MARTLQLEARICLAEGSRAEATQLLRSAMEISRETGVGYIGPAILGVLARATDDLDERDAAMSEGERLLDEGCVGHNYFEFYMECVVPPAPNMFMLATSIRPKPCLRQMS